MRTMALGTNLELEMLEANPLPFLTVNPIISSKSNCRSQNAYKHFPTNYILSISDENKPSDINYIKCEAYLKWIEEVGNYLGIRSLGFFEFAIWLHVCAEETERKKN